MFCASAASLTDELTYSNVDAWSNSGANTTFTSEVSGVQYELENVAFMAFMGGRYGSNTPPGFLYVSTPVGGIEAISTNSASNFKVYLSAEELTPANYTTGDEYSSTDYALLDVSDKGYKYACVAILGAVLNNSYPTIVWNDELGGGDDPVPPTPSVVVPGTDVLNRAAVGNPAHSSSVVMTYVGPETGATYDLNLTSYASGQWDQFYFRDNDNCIKIHAVDAANGVRLTRIDTDGLESMIDVYGSNEPMDVSYAQQGNPIRQLYQYGDKSVEIPAGYEYIMLHSTSTAYFNSMSFTWAENTGGDDPDPDPIPDDVTYDWIPTVEGSVVTAPMSFWGMVQPGKVYLAWPDITYAPDSNLDGDLGVYFVKGAYIKDANGNEISSVVTCACDGQSNLAGFQIPSDLVEGEVYTCFIPAGNFGTFPGDPNYEAIVLTQANPDLTVKFTTTEVVEIILDGGQTGDDLYNWIPSAENAKIAQTWTGTGVFLTWPDLTEEPTENFREEYDNWILPDSYIMDSNGNIVLSTVLAANDWDDMTYAGFEFSGLKAGEEYTCYVAPGCFGTFEFDENVNDYVPVHLNPAFTVKFTTSEVISVTVETGNTPDTPKPGTDTINYGVIVEQNPGAPIADDAYATSPVFNGSMVGGETGIEYAVNGVVLQSPLEQLYMVYDSNSYYIGNITAPEGLWIKSITVVNNYSSIQPTIFYSEEPFEFDARYSQSHMAISGMESKYVIDEPSRYFMIVESYTKFNDIIVEWTDVKPVPTVRTPEIQCYADKYVPGTQAYVKTETIGATLTGRVFINGEAATDYDFTYQQGEWDSYTFAMPGKAYDTVRLEVVGSKEGWVDSETAVAEWTLSEPPCPRPVFNGSSYINYVVEGNPVVINVFDEEGNAIEGADITYRYHGYGTPEGGDPNDDYVYEEWSVWFTAAAPVEVTIPESVKVGMVFDIEAKATAPGYSEGDSREVYPTVKSAKATAPTFSVEDGAQLEAGESFQIIKDWLYPELHYTINGGEEIVTGENNAYVYINAETTSYEVVAWCGGGGFEDSDKVTLNVSLYVLPANVDVLVPDGPSEGDSYKYSLHTLYGSSHNGSIEYLAYCGYWNDAFYLTGSNSSYNAIGYIGNTTAGGFTITKIRVDINNGSTALVYFADEALVDGGTNLLGGAESNAAFGDNGVPCLAIADWYNYGFDIPSFKPNQWIDLAEANEYLIDEGYIDEGDNELRVNDRKYFGIRAFIGSQTMYIDRVMIEYSSDPTSVEGLAADNDDANAVYYNLSGVRVDSDNMTPGLYIRVNGDKASKVVIK